MKKLNGVFIGFLLVGFLFGLSEKLQAQKVLSETETNWVLEAQAEMEKALNDPSLTEQQRLEMVEHSARVLKEYGQPSAFPEDAIPLKKQTDEKFEMYKTQITELSNWSLDLEFQSLEQKNKLINSMQISVAEEQIKFLIPGVTPIQLSKDAVNTVFDWNITDGVNQGARGDAKGLVERFRKLAETKELIKKINLLVENQKDSLRKVYVEKEKYDLLDKKLRERNEYARASTITQRGYEGAKPASETNSESGGFKSNILVGTWKFGYEQTGYFYWTFNNDGSWTFVDKMNEGQDPLTGKYSVFGNTLKLIGPKSECEDVEGTFPFVIEDGDLRFTNIQDPCMSRRFTLSHIWKK